MQQRSLACVAQMQERKTTLGERSTALDHCVDIADHVAAGRFHCSDVTDLPRTKNDLEHCIGIARAHERRATGRRGAIPGVVVRGSVRVVAVLVSTQEGLQAADLQPRDSHKWRDLRTQRHAREETRRQQWRFCTDPDASLAALEAQVSE